MFEIRIELQKAYNWSCHMTTQEFNDVSGMIRDAGHRLDAHSERSLPMTFLNCAYLLQDVEKNLRNIKSKILKMPLLKISFILFGGNKHNLFKKRMLMSCLIA